MAKRVFKRKKNLKKFSTLTRSNIAISLTLKQLDAEKISLVLQLLTFPIDIQVLDTWSDYYNATLSFF